MKTQKKQYACHGIALIAAMIFIIVFAAISIGFLSLSSANTQIAYNHHIGNGPHFVFAAQSGNEIFRYLASGIQVHGIYGTDPTATMREVYTNLQTRITASGMTCIALSPYPYTGTGPISISNVSLSADGRKTFSIELGAANSDATIVYVHITGDEGQASRRIGVNYNLAEHGHGVFDYGIATKGPLLCQASQQLPALTWRWNQTSLLTLLSSAIRFLSAESFGTRRCTYREQVRHLFHQRQCRGETGHDAEDHVIVGVAPGGLPTPNVQHFRQFATGPVINSTNYSQHSVETP